MIFYEATLKILSKEEGQNRVHYQSSRLNEELELVQRELAAEHQIVFHLRSRTLTDNVMLKLASQRPVDTQKIAHILAPLMPDAEITVSSIDEISFYDFIRPIVSTNKEIRLFHELGVEGAMNLEDVRPSFENNFERICQQIDEADYAYQSNSLKEEIRRIHGSAREEFQPGNPAHYAIHASGEAMMHEILSVLVDSLFKAKRLISRRIFVIDMGLLRIKGDNAGSEDPPWLEPFCLMSAGGTILVKVPYISFGFSQSPKSESELKKRRYLSVVEKLFALNKGRAQFVFAFDPVYSKENIMLALTETFPHDLFVPLFAQGAKASFAREFLESEARRNHIETDESLFTTLENKAEYSEKELRVHLDGWSRQRLLASEYPEYEAIRPLDVDRLQPKMSALHELDSLIGLAETKRQIKRVITNIKFQERRHKEGLDNQHPCLHMMFMGNPGTGKTTVARLIGEIYVSKGIIPCGRFFEVSPVSLKGDVSWRDIFEQARGSVLFIDEAYTLGNDAIDQLVPYLENYRDDTVVIFAGYKGEMKNFLGKNSGLASRIPYHIDFPNYTPAELVEITDSVLVEKNYTVSAHTRRMLQRDFRRLRFMEGNARDIRNMVEKAISEAADRLSQLDLEALSREELRTLELSDFTPVLRHLGKEYRRKAATSFFGSPLFTVPATHSVKLGGRIIGSRVSGKRITKKDALALVPELAISIGTELAIHSISKASAAKKH